MRPPVHSSAKGFTLLEVMVVLVIIAMMMSMVGLAPSGNEQKKEAEMMALKLKSLLQAYREDAVFYNRDLGLALDGQSFLLFEYYDLRNPTIASALDKEQLPAIKDNPWSDYTGKLESQLELEEQLFYRLEIEGEEIDLAEDEGEEGPKVRLEFLASDEYRPFKITLSHQYDDSFAVIIKGNGLGRINTETVNYED